MLIREDTRRKCGQRIIEEEDSKRVEKWVDNYNRMKISEGRETSEDGRGKKGKTVGTKV